MSVTKSKLMTAKEAISRFFPDGCSFVVGNFLHPAPHALLQEVIRQGKKDLTFWSQSSVEEVEQFLLAGCASRVVTAFNYRAGGKEAKCHLEDHFKAGTVDVEDYSNYTLLMCLKAAALGLPFIPVADAIRETDIFRIRRFLGDRKFGIVKSPFDGREHVVVPAYSPDVCLVHVQRASEQGNAQFWGPAANVKWAILASKQIIVSAEEIVAEEVINASPELTVAPAFRVSAVVHEPWGGHPGELLGCYNGDLNFRSLFFMQSGNPQAAKGWLDEWVYGVADRREYVQHYIERFGLQSLEYLRARTTISAPANHGHAFRRPWDDSGYSERFQMNKEQFEKLLEEKGEFV